MNKLILKYSLYIIGGYTLLGLSNLIIRNSLNVQNIVVLLLVLITIYFGKKYIKDIVKTLNKLSPLLVFLIIAIPALISLFVFNPSYWNDVLMVHNSAITDLNEGTVKIGDPYSIRNLFYLIPIYAFLGTKLWIVKIINLIIYSLTAFIFFKILKTLFINKINYAYVGVLLFFSVPYFALSVSIPHYDLPGTFYLMLSLAIIQHLIKIINLKNSNDLHIFLYSMILGISFIPLFYTRGSFRLLLLTFLLFTFLFLFLNSLKSKVKLKLLFSMFFVPFLIFILFNNYIKGTKYIDNSDELWTSEQMVFSYNDTRFDGTSGHQDKKWEYFPKIDEDLRKKYALFKLNSEMHYNWHWYLYMVTTKNAEVLKIGGLNHFITHDYLYKNELDTIFENWELVLQYVISLFAVVGLIYFISSRNIDLFRLFTLSFLFSSTFFVIFTEARSRYSLIFVFALIIFALDGLKCYLESDFSIKRLFKKGVSYSLVSILFFGSIFFIYKQSIAKNNHFVQIAPRIWGKNIGKINLTAFQKRINENDSKVYLGNAPKGKGSVSFFIRAPKDKIDNIKVSLYQGNQMNELSIKPGEFEDLYHSPELAVNFFRIYLDKEKENDSVYLDFEGSFVDENLLVEYVSFNR